MARPRRWSQSIRFGTSVRAASEPGLEMMPTVLMMGIEEKLLVPFRAQNGAFDHVREKSEFAHGPRHPKTGGLADGRVAHDAALAHLALARLKLRFDQYNHLPAGTEQRHGSGQDQSDGDEADVARDQVDGLADLGEGEFARVDAFMEDDARVGAELPGKLAGADVDGMDARGAGLQEGVGEPAGRGADIEGDLAGAIDGEMAQRGRELEAAAADVRRAREDFDRGIRIHGMSRLGGLLPADENFARHDEGLRFFAGLGEAALDEQAVEAEFHGRGPIFTAETQRTRRLRGETMGRGDHDLRCTIKSASSCRRAARAANSSSTWCARAHSSSAMRREASRP